MMTSNITSMTEENDLVTQMLNATNDDDNIIEEPVFAKLLELAQAVCHPYYMMTQNTPAGRAAKNNNFDEVHNTAPNTVAAARTVHKRWLSKYAFLHRKLFALFHQNIEDQENIIRYLCRIGALARGYWHYADGASYP